MRNRLLRRASIPACRLSRANRCRPVPPTAHPFSFELSPGLHRSVGLPVLLVDLVDLGQYRSVLLSTFGLFAIPPVVISSTAYLEDLAHPQNFELILMGSDKPVFTRAPWQSTLLPFLECRAPPSHE